LQWASTAGTNSTSNFPLRVGSDALGNAYLAGHFAGSITLGTNILASSSPADMFVAKYNPQGQVLWAERIAAYDYAYWDPFGLGVDGAGNVVLASRDSGLVDFGSLVLTNSTAFLAKYDSTGNLLWASESPPADALAVGTNGSIYLTGSPGMLAKYDHLGNLLWSKPFLTAQAIILDPQENIYTTGYGGGSYNGQPVTNASGMADFYVAKCNPAGDWLWLQQAGSTQQQRGSAVALDGSGGLYVTSFSANARPDPVLSFGALTLSNVYSFLAEYDSAGNPLWVKALGTTNRLSIRGLAAADSGTIYLGGTFSSSASLGNFTLLDTNQFSWGSLLVAKLAGLGPPQLGPPSWSGGNQLQLSLTAAPGFRCAVEASTNLLDWVPLGTNASPFTFTDGDAPNFPHRFYRAAYRP
jgi:hypothetical protein